MGAFLLQVGSASLRGQDHPLNEDALYFVTGDGAQSAAQVEQHGYLLAVADGGGGPLAALALQVLTSAYYGQMGRNVAENVRRAIHESNVRAPSQNQHQAAQPAKAGATLTAVVVKDQLLYVANVGDSRAYLLREGTIWPLTRDHSDEEGGPARQLGISPYLEPDIYLPLALDAGDRLLLCTDGLTDAVTSVERLAQLLGRHTPETAVAELVSAAREAGNGDDVSVIVAELRPPLLLAGLTRAQVAILAGMAAAALLLFLWMLAEIWISI
jgi:protein phosphatase